MNYISLMRNPDGCVVCFTDGACPMNGQPGAKAGIGVYFGDNHPCLFVAYSGGKYVTRNVSQPLNPNLPQTNNTAEIRAAVEAIYQARKYGEYYLQICSDSEIMIKGITLWINEWERNGWMTYDGIRWKPVVNKTDFLVLKNAINSMGRVNFVHVKAHSGYRGNEEADKLAKNGASGTWQYL